MTSLVIQLPGNTLFCKTRLVLALYERKTVHWRKDCCKPLEDNIVDMRKILYMLIAMTLTLAACSSSGSGGGGPQVGTAACENDAQKQFVLDAMRDIYFWYDLLPANVVLSQHATPEALLAFLISFQPLDDFSFITTAEADAQFFGEGKFEGFGFSSRYEAAEDLRFTRVFSGSPAAQADFSRGQQILELDEERKASMVSNLLVVLCSETETQPVINTGSLYT